MDILEEMIEEVECAWMQVGIREEEWREVITGESPLPEEETWTREPKSENREERAQK